MNCIDCKYALWAKTTNGRLHPSGDGKCTWKMPTIILPISFYYPVGRNEIPQPLGGYIDRKKLRDCPAWEEK